MDKFHPRDTRAIMRPMPNTPCVFDQSMAGVRISLPLSDTRGEALDGNPVDEQHVVISLQHHKEALRDDRCEIDELHLMNARMSRPHSPRMAPCSIGSAATPHRQLLRDGQLIVPQHDVLHRRIAQQ